MAIHRPTPSDRSNNNGDTIQRDGESPFGSFISNINTLVNRSILFSNQKFYYRNNGDLNFINSDFVPKPNPMTDFGFEHGRQFIYSGKDYTRYEFGGDE